MLQRKNAPPDAYPNTRPSGPGYRYRAFISYSHADEKFAKWLLGKLESYRIPPHLIGKPGRNGLIPNTLAPVFRDRDELESGHNLGARIARALQESAALIVIASPASANSVYVNNEVLEFKRLGRSQDIYCLIVAGEPGSETEECFCPGLLCEVNTEGSLSEIPAEPIAADARITGDGKARALTKLAAGLLGVDFDELFQREVARRHRRMMVITVGALAATTLTVALLVMAIFARDDAERRRIQAEDLIGFLVGDLYEKLYEIDRMDVFNAVGKKTTEYFATLEPDDLTDTMLAQRAESLRKIGEAQLDQGRLDNALEAFTLALDISRNLSDSDRLNVSRTLELAESHYWIGAVRWQQGDLSGAAQAFTNQMNTQKDAASHAPRNAELVRDIGYSTTNLGRIEESQGNLQSALEYYLEVLQQNERYAELTDNSDDAMLEIGFANNNLGKLAMSMGKLHDARSHFQTDYQIKKRIFDENPQNEMLRWDLASSARFLGQAYEYLGQNAKSRSLYDSALETTQKMLSEDPDSHARLMKNAVVAHSVSDFLERQGRSEQAFLLGKSVSSALIDRQTEGQNDPSLHFEIAALQAICAQAALNLDKLEIADELSRNSVDSLTGLAQESPELVHISSALMQARNIRSDILSAMGYKTKADELRRQSLLQFSALVQPTYNPDLLEPYLIAGKKTGEMTEHSVLLQRLLEMDYQRSGQLSGDD